MALQQNVQVIQPDLMVDGYTSCMFGPQDVESYYISLLKREPRQFQWHTDINIMGAFLAPPPPGLASDRDLVIDYAVKDAGPVIRQEIWTPKKPSDKVRRVDHEQLNPPIFFIREEGGDLGLPLIEAAEGSCVSLRGAEEAAPVDAGTHSTHAQIRINVSFNLTLTVQI